MPGLNFVFAFNEPIESKSADYRAALDKTLFEESHSCRVLFEDEQLLSSITSHDSYPVRTFESNGTKFCIEGKVYNFSEDQVDDAITSIVERLLQNDETAAADLKDWLLAVDGEFIIFAYNKAARRILIINDIFGLLPCYIHKTDWGVVFSRNYSFVTSMVKQKQFDRLALAQFLMFRHTIGRRTYFKDVYRLKPAELVSIEAVSGDIHHDVLYVFNFDEKKHSNRSAKENAVEIAKLFTEGCRSRVESENKTVVSLSGGLDSRADATALSKAGVEFEARSILDSNKVAQTDVKIAQQVASALEVEWNSIDAKAMTGRNMLRILRMRSGLVYIGKVHPIQLYDKIVSDYGHKVSLFVGLGGDRIGHDIRTTGPKKITTLSEVLRRHPKFMSFETLSKITGISEEEFFEEVKKELLSYPEKNMSQKCVHLEFYSQTFNWHFEGHDRLRSFFWPASPFFSTPFFKYIMNCPDKQKKNLRLYYYFLNQLNPKVSDIPCARNEFLTPISLVRCKSLVWYWYCELCLLYRRICKLPNPIRFVIRRIKKKLCKPEPALKREFIHPDNLIKCFNDQISNCRHQQDNLNWTEIEEVVNNSEKHMSQALFNLFTVTSMIEDITIGQSSLEKYSDLSFGSFNPTLHKKHATENY